MASGYSGGEKDDETRAPRPITERFQTAVAMIKSLPKEGPYMADNKTKLRFYALYKQATEGPCHTSQPGFWDLVGKAKWEAWNVCGNMNKEIAMQLYVEELTEMVKVMPQTTEVEEFLESVSPYYPEEKRQSSEDGDSEVGVASGEVGVASPLSSTMLHHIDELDMSSADIVANSDEDEVSVREGEREGEGGVSSNDEEYQESFQDLQSGQVTTDGELSSPWQYVSQESLSPSFELVQSDQQTTHSHEEPLTSHRTMDEGRGECVGDRESSRVVTIQHRSSATSGDGVIVRGGGGEGVNSSGHSGNGVNQLDSVLSQVRLVQEQVESVLQQLRNLSHTLQGLVQQYYGPTGQPQTGTQPQLVVRRPQWRLRQIIHLSMMLLGWPLLVHTLIAFLFRKHAVEVPLWVWSAVSVVHVIISFILNLTGHTL